MKSEQHELLDAHVHLQDSRFAGDLEAVLERSRLAGVVRWVCNGASERDWAQVLELARKQPAIIPCLGLHPWHVAERSSQWLDNLERLLAGSSCGVGEVGLDRWIKNRRESEQEEVFRQQIRLARRWNRPLMIHCVRAWDWLMQVLPEELPQPHPLLIHAYGGPPELISRLTEMGAYFSFAGNIFQPHKASARALLTSIPPDRLLLETDAPDLPPPPDYRRQDFARTGSYRNEPANLAAIFMGITRLLGQSPESLARQLWQNGERFLARLLGPGCQNLVTESDAGMSKVHRP